jgi:hypothetical protein
LVNGKVKEKKLEVHHTSESESSELPPYVLPVCSATLASPRSESNAQGPNGKEKISGLDPHPCHPVVPSLYPPLPPMTPKKEMNHWGRSLNSGRLTSKEGGAPAAALCLLCQSPGLPLSQRYGSYVAGPMQYTYQPFPTTNLLNWQQHTPAYSEEPKAV